MARLRKFFDKPGADRRLLLQAALLHLFVAGAVRVLPFGRVRRVLGRVAACGARRLSAPDADVRVVRAVRTVASLLPGANCLTEALVAQCLLARAGCGTTLCFGVSGARPAARPFDAHAWIERAGHGVVIGARALTYEPFHQPRNSS
jgi:hypothetical protein